MASFAATLLLVSVLLGFYPGGCGRGNGGPLLGRDLPTLVPGKLKVGTHPNFPPFESLEGGKVVGFDVDLMEEVASRLKLELEWVSVSWEDIFKGLEEGHYDIAASSITITSGRSQLVDFSSPYLKVDQSICVREGSPVRGPGDLKGLRVGVMAGTTGEEMARNIPGVGELVRYPTIREAFQDLEYGKIDAVVNDYPTNLYLSGMRKGMAVTALLPTGEKYGLALRKGNVSLLEAVNWALEQIMGDGTYERLLRRWFGEGNVDSMKP